MNNSTVKKALNFYHPNPLPVFACQFFKINDLHASKTSLFRTVDLILMVKSNIIIIVMNTDKKISVLLKFTKLEKLTHCRPSLWTEPY